MKIRDARLDSVLPPDHPLSAAVFRIVILREDLMFEFGGISADRLGDLDRGDPLCRRIFFLRKTLQTLYTLSEVLREPAFHLALKNAGEEARQTTRDAIARLLKEIRREGELFKEVRNEAIAHMNKERYQRVLEQEHDFRYFMQLGRTYKTTFFRLPYAASIAALTGPASTEDEFIVDARRMLGRAGRVTSRALRLTDLICYTLFTEIGYPK